MGENRPTVSTDANPRGLEEFRPFSPLGDAGRGNRLPRGSGQRVGSRHFPGVRGVGGTVRRVSCKHDESRLLPHRFGVTAVSE